MSSSFQHNYDKERESSLGKARNITHESQMTGYAMAAMKEQPASSIVIMLSITRSEPASPPPHSPGVELRTHSE